MRKTLTLVVIAAFAAGCASCRFKGDSCGRDANGRFIISRKPYPTKQTFDYTILLDTVTGDTWRYDKRTKGWTPMPR